jgi:LCP family protein required for cell wall assembly
MPGTEKPYRVYRGGRAKGNVPLQSRPERRSDGRANGRPQRPQRPPRPRRPANWWRRAGVALLLVVLFFVVWGIAGWISVSRGVSAANGRLNKLAPDAAAALDQQSGLLLSHPTDILLLGSDFNSRVLARANDRHSDSIMIVRTDPSRHRIVYLSIPRDLKVTIPGHGDNKINAAFQYGGPALAIKTIKTFTGIPINHVVVVDFNSFRKLIDDIGGINVYVPERILSNPFDCPYTKQRCLTWPGWRFGKGWQHMDGRHALVYSRIRENKLNPSESDVTRGERQQAVLQAIASKLSGPGEFFRLPFNGGSLLRPLATDLSTGQFAQLAWIKFRSSASKTLHCRLGGDAAYYGGQAVIVPNEDNRSVVLEVLGQSAPQPPRPGAGPYAPGCVVGSTQHVG